MFAPNSRRTGIATIATCAIAALAVTDFSAVASRGSASVRRDARVVRVIDGDELVLKTRAGVARYRLLGVSAPALGNCFGLRSRTRLRALLPAGARVRVTARRRGSRSVVVLLRGAGVNRLVVQSGHAQAKLKDGSRLARILSSAQSRAEDDGRGLWGACRPEDDAPQPASPQTADAVARPGTGGAQQPAPNPTPAAAPAGETTRLSQAQFQAFIENSAFTRVTNSSSFGGSSNRNDFTFCSRGLYGFNSESFNNGFTSSASETGRWKIATLARNTQLQADEATLELVTEASSVSDFDPNSPESGRTFQVLIQSFDDGRVRLGSQPTERSAATNCPA